MGSFYLNSAWLYNIAGKGGQSLYFEFGAMRGQDAKKG